MNKKQYNAFLKESIQNIKTAIDNNNLSVFAGSGISYDSDFPLWSDLIDEIKKSLKTKESDYLKIAELFYIQFKENKYYEKLSEYFPQNSFANMLHKKIVSLNVKNIITTNWDELFEKAIYENGEFFDIIKDDKDISYSTGFSKLVKMHGSIDTKNIVFKESDYLNYSLNFPLVENYVKSIFSTDTTLLVGYSLNDVNVKQIISWVNFHSKSIKPIYFLKVNSEFDYLEFEYYKSKNIFILYWNENLALESECSTQNVSQLGLKGQMTYNFLHKISIQNSDINLLSFKEILYVLHDTFKVLKDYQFVQTAISLNDTMKFKNGYLKYFLRKVVENKLPKNIVWRTNKFGFEAPSDTWIEKNRELMIKDIKESNIIQHVVNLNSSLYKNNKLLWKLYNIAIWEKIYKVKI